MFCLRMGIAKMERLGMRVILLLACLSIATLSSVAKGTIENDRATVIIAVGAAGEEDYGKEFVRCAELWTKASDKAGAKHVVTGIGPTNTTTDLSILKQSLVNEPTNSTADLWIVLI